MRFGYALAVGLLVTTTASAQPARKGAAPSVTLPPGRTITPPTPPTTNTATIYADSAKFVEAWKDFYRTVRPAASMKDLLNKQITASARNWKARGVDSALAMQKIMGEVDTAMAEKFAFSTYRAVFTAEELKALAAFVKTSAGKKWIAEEPKLMQARAFGPEQYLQRTIAGIVTPMMKPIERKPVTAAPPTPPTPPGLPTAAPTTPPGRTVIRAVPDNAPQGK